jgi:methyl-accepting chemotaxis protein
MKRSNVMKSVMIRRALIAMIGLLVIPAGARAEGERDALSAQDREVLGWANQLAAETSQLLERWLQSRAISEERLFARLYYPIPRTDPPKYTTEYSGLADRDLPPLQEAVVRKSGAVVFAVVTDLNGYLPTHNQRYSLPLTGNLAFDLVNNRTKRIFGDRTGISAARSEAPYLLQRYKRDTGELMADLSVPVRVRGKHWGCVRIGYRQVEKP